MGLLAVTLLLLSTGAVEAGAAVRSELRVRAASAGDAVSSSGDLVLDSRLGLRLGRDSGLAAAYAPSFWLPAWGSEAQLRVLHQGEVEVRVSPSRSVALRLVERVASGERELTLLSDLEGDGLQRVPAARRVRWLSSDTRASLEARLSRRLSLGLGLGFQLSGGDEDSRAVLPQQRGPWAVLGLGLVLTRQDALRAELSASHADFDGGAAATLATARLAWSRGISPTLTARLALGGGFSRTANSSDLVPAWSLLPVAEASMGYRPSERLQLGVTLAAAPRVDRLTSESYERAEASVSLGLLAHRRVALAARASGGVVAWGARQGDALGAVEASASWLGDPVRPGVLLGAAGESQGGPEWTLALAVRAAAQGGEVGYSEVGAALVFTVALRGRRP